MKEFINVFNLFPTPVWRYAFTDFAQHKLDILAHLDDKYLSDEEYNGLQITRPELHKQDAMAPVKDFIQSCFEDTMEQMGYSKEIGITGMWATRHREGGFHHAHIHKNTFLSCVFYLHDVDSKANGTLFYNQNTSLYQIEPAVKEQGKTLLRGVEEVPFVAGTCLVFPGWVGHGSRPSESKYRVIIGANAMPIGMTNNDHYDRYNYPDPDGLVLKQYEGQ